MLIKSGYSIISPENCANYAELLRSVTTCVDAENWDYFSEDVNTFAKEFLNYGEFSRIVIYTSEFGDVTTVGYVQFRVLKSMGGSFLYNDFYHTVGLSGFELWDETCKLHKNSDIYVDVIAIKQAYQSKLLVSKLILKSVGEIVSDLNQSVSLSSKVYAVGVTDLGRKMCNMLNMQLLSEVKRSDSKVSSHTRTLYCSDFLVFNDNLLSILNRKGAKTYG